MINSTSNHLKSSIKIDNQKNSFENGQSSLFARLPAEILNNIVANLPLRDRNNLSSINHYFYNINKLVRINKFKVKQQMVDSKDKIKSLTSFLKHNHIKYLDLTDLNLDLNNYAFVENIIQIKSLTILNISGNKINLDTIKIISYIPNLCQLNVSDCRIGVDEIAVIGQMQNLKALYIHGNDLRGSRAEIVLNMPNLIELDISNCNLGAEGALLFNNNLKLENLKARYNNLRHLGNTREGINSID